MAIIFKSLHIIKYLIPFLTWQISSRQYRHQDLLEFCYYLNYWKQHVDNVVSPCQHNTIVTDSYLQIEYMTIYISNLTSTWQCEPKALPTKTYKLQVN